MGNELDEQEDQPNELDDQEDHDEHDNAVDVAAAATTSSTSDSERVPLIPAQTEKISPDGLGGWKTIVKYKVLDDYTPLILLDGCPTSKCKGLSKRDTSFCLFDQREIRRRHDECMTSEDGEYIGCVTDRLPTGR